MMAPPLRRPHLLFALAFALASATAARASPPGPAADAAAAAAAAAADALAAVAGAFYDYVEPTVAATYYTTHNPDGTGCRTTTVATEPPGTPFPQPECVVNTTHAIPSVVVTARCPDGYAAAVQDACAGFKPNTRTGVLSSTYMLAEGARGAESVCGVPLSSSLVGDRLDVIQAIVCAGDATALGRAAAAAAATAAAAGNDTARNNAALVAAQKTLAALAAKAAGAVEAETAEAAADGPLAAVSDAFSRYLGLFPPVRGTYTATYAAGDDDQKAQETTTSGGSWCKPVLVDSYPSDPAPAFGEAFCGGGMKPPSDSPDPKYYFPSFFMGVQCPKNYALAAQHMCSARVLDASGGVVSLLPLMGVGTLGGGARCEVALSAVPIPSGGRVELTQEFSCAFDTSALVQRGQKKGGGSGGGGGNTDAARPAPSPDEVKEALAALAAAHANKSDGDGDGDNALSPSAIASVFGALYDYTMPVEAAAATLRTNVAEPGSGQCAPPEVVRWWPEGGPKPDVRAECEASPYSAAVASVKVQTNCPGNFRAALGAQCTGNIQNADGAWLSSLPVLGQGAGAEATLCTVDTSEWRPEGGSFNAVNSITCAYNTDALLGAAAAAAAADAAAAAADARGENNESGGGGSARAAAHAAAAHKALAALAARAARANERRAARAPEENNTLEALLEKARRQSGVVVV